MYTRFGGNSDSLELCDFSLATGHVTPRFTWLPHYQGHALNFSSVEYSTDSRLMYFIGSTDSSWQTIHILLSPVADLGPDVTVCAGDAATFTASPCNGCTIIWKDVIADTVVCTSQVFRTTHPGIYSIREIQPNGCEGRDTVGLFTGAVHPVSITIHASANPVCEASLVVFIATAINKGPAPVFLWEVNGAPAGASDSTFACFPLNGDTITCTVTSTDPCAMGNPSTSLPVIMTVYDTVPAGITVTGSPNPFCPGLPVTFTAIPSNSGPGRVFQWKMNNMNVGSNSTSFVYNPSLNDSVWCVMISNLDCVTGNPAVSNKIFLNGSLAPPVSFTACFDTITTTNAKPFRLKGGIPLGGTYSGAGVSNGFYYPNIAGAGTHIITYNYTNAAMCSASAHSSVHQFISSSAPCGSALTDIRDGQTYPTIQIGSQCWMAANLNYGIPVPSTQYQRDNCIPERYKSGDYQVRFCERLGVKLPRSTRHPAISS
jgi:hypothetical protein